MILTQMCNSPRQLVVGTLEDGTNVLLGVPQPHAVAGHARWLDCADVVAACAVVDLKNRARIDAGNYYSIGELTHSKDKKIFVIPYTTFIV